MADAKKGTPKKTADSPKNQLKTLLKTIDEIDGKLLDLINQRLLIGKAIGQIKHADEGRMCAENRENEMIHRLISLNKGPLNQELLCYLFSNIIAATREIQEPKTVTYLGPEATYSHIAAMNHFGHMAKFLPKPGIHDIFAAVEKGSCHFGVVPVENSIEGAVNHTLDLLFESNVKICAEFYQPISHDLLSLSGNLKMIEIVYSHAQPIGQCRKWLRDNLPDAEIQACSSTAVAAQKAAENPKAAAIASSRASQVYKLKIVESNIEDFSKNMTRFLIIGHDEIARTGKDKTSIMFVTAHLPGALYRVLEPIAKSNINMLKLESRPTKHENWNYFFFIDLEGHIEDSNVKAVICDMKKLCLNVKILGSYPMRQEGYSSKETP